MYYSSPTNKKRIDHESILAEYHVSAGNSDVAALDEQIRIDGNGSKPYAIPADNSFVNKQGRDKIWTYGLRNPWRFSFDCQIRQLFCGDVGQNAYEEVSIIEKGKNYGWRAMESFHEFDKALIKDPKVFAAPIDEYDHQTGSSITDGYVYRGKQIPALAGKYVFADWSGKVFYLTKTGNDWKRTPCSFEGKSELNFRINSFGEDEAEELYILTQEEVGGKSKTVPFIN